MVSRGHGGKHESGRKASEGGRGYLDKVNPAAVERYLRGIAFPATKDDLIEQARDNDAPGDVLKALDMLDDKRYDSVVDITKEVGKYE